MAAFRNVTQGTPEWFEARRGRLTSSQIGVVLGWNPFKSREELAAEYVTGESQSFVSEACNYGQDHEDAARDRYARWLKRQNRSLHVEETGFWVNEHHVSECFVENQEHDREERAAFCMRIGGSPDGIVVDAAGRRVGCIEIKAPCYGFRVTPKFKNNIQYMLQAQVNCWLLDVPWCDFVVWTPMGMGVWRIPRADTVSIPSTSLKTKTRFGPIISNVQQMQEFVRLDLYDPVNMTFTGYWRVLMEVLWAFDRAARAPTPPKWYHWGLNHDPHINMIKAVNKHVEQQSQHIVDFEDEGVVPRGFVNWASWLRWSEVADQMHVQLAERPVFWGRWACRMANGDWVHLASLDGLDPTAPPNEAFVDFYGESRTQKKHVDVGINDGGKTVTGLPTEAFCFVTLKHRRRSKVAAFGAFRMTSPRSEHRFTTPLGTVVVTFTGDNAAVTVSVCLLESNELTLP